MNFAALEVFKEFDQVFCRIVFPVIVEVNQDFGDQVLNGLKEIFTGIAHEKTGEFVPFFVADFT